MHSVYSYILLLGCVTSVSAELQGSDGYLHCQGSLHCTPTQWPTLIESTALVQVPVKLHRRQSVTLETNGSNQLQLQHQVSNNLFPVYWVHIPKCGSTFLNSLMNLPGACNFDSTGITPKTDIAGLFHGHRQDGLKRPIIRTACPGSFSFDGDVATHSGIGSIYESVVKGHGLIMLRQPEQRILSGYYHRIRNEPHSWPLWHYGRSPKNATEYAKVVSGCAVKILTRRGYAIAQSHYSVDAPCGHPTLAVTHEETQIAIHRLRAGFIFVGITEDWDMSICLFHMMVGGACHSSEFVNSNPGNRSSGGQYETSVLDGFTDIFDGALYEEAKRIYAENLQKYGVSASTCEPCFQHRNNSNSKIN